jgi:hypothetical protein
MTETCHAITHKKSPYDLYSKKGSHVCERTATYTDGKGRFFCTQHAKNFATVLQKSNNRIRDGLHRIEEAKA